ncbi:hypothetical protein SAMN06265365_15027 [Tistlia consotensis]|uniref:DNA gyrase inhibitor YacG n=1 Tax=Tistlia consotensis USBA 355 TaxID=560819 RepID=A0A1Y6CRU4_9PROT|nr:DNA gyrase inhibitor YacG [Tistlia consotensis]SMF83492.1 hypothetical protein SAMN05428998_1506 [Tistlia consotensis USBA 355]SNS33891.1 hypothetical protein SAMN06265365_15027 [Tistlia consotensis]
MSEDDRIVPFPERRKKARAPRCPICGKPGIAAHEPFCSARCQQVDLGRWLNGSYRVETDEAPEEPPGSGGERSDG